MSRKHIGSSLESFLEEEGVREEAALLARKKILADQMIEAMTRAKVSKVQLAKAMRTSRTVVHRLLDPTNTGVTLETLARVATALHLDLQVSLAPARRRRATR